MINEYSSQEDSKLKVRKQGASPRLNIKRNSLTDKDKSLGKDNDDGNTSIKKKRTKRPMKKEAHNLIEDKYEFFPSLLLGKGEFGDVCVCCDLQDTSKHYAMKFESSYLSNKLKLEKEILELMTGVEGFPYTVGNGAFKAKNYLVIERLGPNLKDLFQYCHSHFSLQTVLLIGIQIMTRLHDFHFKSGYIHGDVKPDNFMIGLKNTNLIYIADFGLSKAFRIVNNQTMKVEHIPFKDNIKITNTHRFASINSHMGIETSRRDDLESLGYMLIYFANHSLPWQGGSKSNKDEKSMKMLEKKTTIPVEVYCKDLPIEFCIYMNYVRNLRFNEKPDYNFLKGLFSELLFTYYIEKFYFDWSIMKPKEIPINLRIDKDLDNKANGTQKRRYSIRKRSLRPKISNVPESDEDNRGYSPHDNLIDSSAKESDSQRISLLSKSHKVEDNSNIQLPNKPKVIQEGLDQSSDTESNGTEQNSFFNDEDFVSMFKEVVAPRKNTRSISNSQVEGGMEDNANNNNKNLPSNTAKAFRVKTFKSKNNSSITNSSNSNSVGPFIEDQMGKSYRSNNSSNSISSDKKFMKSLKKSAKKINMIYEEEEGLTSKR